MSLPCYLSTRTLCAESVDSLPSSNITHDWTGELLPAEIRFLLLLEPEYLLLYGTVPGVEHFNRGHSIGDYVEGLWEHDVVELFIADRTTGQYQEFNLSPTGAWWHCRFSSYRTRIVPNVPPISPDISVSLVRGVLRFRLGLARKELLVDPASDKARLNICGIIGSPRRYFSCAEGERNTPDFHRAELYLPLEFRQPADENSLTSKG